MKTISTYCFIALLFLFVSPGTKAQCPGGFIPGSTFFDTTIQFATGTNNTEVRFPKFDPQQAMLSCVRLTVTITGIVDTVAMQNYSASAQTANFFYNRKDSMSGPGLTPSLTHAYNGLFGPYSLAPYDGVAGAGSDFRAISKDTVLQQVMVRTLTDSTAISQFYGLDTMIYQYNINVTTSAVITGGSSSSLVLTSALVHFRLEYCTCPYHSLALGLKEFNVKRTGPSAASVRWKARDDAEQYVYEVQVKKEDSNFETISSLNRRQPGINEYRLSYSIDQPDRSYQFRIARREQNGTIRYSEVRWLTPDPASTVSLEVFPNPSNGSVSIRLFQKANHTFHVVVRNMTGQEVHRVRVQSPAAFQPEKLMAGMYLVSVYSDGQQLLGQQKLVVH